MSVEEITKKIAKDTSSSGAIARRMAERITNLHQDLAPAVAAYLAGESVSFSLGDITLQTIMEKERCSLVEALFSMNTLLEKPELAERYKSMTFRRGCLEG
jgi:dethiobiotin synthetase